MYLTPEQMEIGKTNFLGALGSIRREFLEKSLQAPSIGMHYFGYGAAPEKPVRAGIIGTGNEGCDAMIMQSSPKYLEFVAHHDIRPTQIKRARERFKTLYGAKKGEQVKFHENWSDMLADKDIEAIVVATPLWTHSRLTIEALEAGKHVLCEKLMSHNIADGKAMVRAADKAEKVLSIGHQRHYSTLYDNALAVIQSGVLGEIRHIRALWHRNNTWPKEKLKDSDVKKKTGDFLHDGWTPEIPEDDRSVDFGKYGYKSIEELVRWRLYNRTGGGLMAELGSHQLDACSLFLNKVHPKTVAGIGEKYFYEDDRECEDHVYCMYEMPGNVVITYSSINTNALEGYGEIVTGTLGTLMIMNERDVMLFKERAPGDKEPSESMYVAVNGEGKLESIPQSASMSSNAALAKLALDRAVNFKPQGAAKEMVNRGYFNEMEAFADAVRNPGKKVRCDGHVALADAVMALTTNIAMKNHARIEFKPAWYDPAATDVPDEQGAPALAGK